jgi:arylsulfatase A-like enzyme
MIQRTTPRTATCFFVPFVTLLAATLEAEAAHDPGRTHVLLIMTDDMGWLDLGCQGNERLNTPRIDAFAKQGVRFTDAYAAAPVCSPTRAALITGRAPARLHITQHGADGPRFWPKDRTIQPPPARHILPHQTVTIAERLQAAGYATGFFGKWHLSGTNVRKGDPSTGGPEFYPDRHGFEINVGGCGFGGPPTYFDPFRIPTIEPRREGEYLTDRLADETIAWMHASRDRPKFACIWTYNPHFPLEAPEDLVRKYQGMEGPGLKRAAYGGQIEAIDRAVGRVFDAIDRLGIADRTLVIFTSDNGGWEGATDNRPLRSGKGDLYEGGIRVPLIIRWPGVTKAGATNSTPVISMDLAATILDAVGVEVGDHESLDGISLRPLLTGQLPRRPPLFFHYPHFAWHRSNRPAAAVRDGRYKLIRRFDDDSVELYDLSADIGERNDLAKQKPALTASLRARLDAWLSETGADLPTPRE